MLTGGLLLEFLWAVDVERLEVLACGLLSRVMDVASRSHSASPLAEVSLELEAALPVSSQSEPPCARVLQVGGFPLVFVELVGGMLGRATLVTEDDVFRQDIGGHRRGGVSRVGISQFADDEIVFWRGRFHAVN